MKILQQGTSEITRTCVKCSCRFVTVKTDILKRHNSCIITATVDGQDAILWAYHTIICPECGHTWKLSDVRDEFGRFPLDGLQSNK